MNKNTYTKDDIETLDFVSAVQKRPEMYLGSADMNGVYQTIREIITNSIDEYTMGYNKLIKVSLEKGVMTITDEARGVPFGTREDGTDAMIAIFTSPHSGGKFNNKVYQNVGGLNGIGGKAAALTSETFYAESRRDGQVARLIIKKGKVESFKITKEKYAKKGTTVAFKPDQDVFRLEPIKIDFEVVKDMCQTWAYLSPGLTFELLNKDNNQKVNYSYNDGIIDLLKSKLNKPIHQHIIQRTETDEDGNKVQVALQWSRERREVSHVFTNGLENINGGTSLTGARSAVTRTINNLAGVRLKGDSVRMGLHYVINSSVLNPSFSDQTKSRINNPELRGLADRAVSEAIKEFAEEHRAEWEKLVDVLVREEKAEKAAEAARERILSVESDLSKAHKRTNLELPSKVADATNKTGYRELYLSEGDSASAYLISTRDAATQGVMPLRGKILNTYDLELHEAYENEEVRAILTLLASGAGSVYNAKKLRYEKIIIAADSDSDGNHIAILVIGLFLRHTPQLIADGKLYKLVAPFYGVGKGKNYKLLYSEKELSEYEAKHGKQKDMDRFKGLGAMSEELTGKVLMDPKYRRLEQIKMSDLEEMRELFDTLLGKDIDGRRYLVSEGKLNE